MMSLFVAPLLCGKAAILPVFLARGSADSGFVATISLMRLQRNFFKINSIGLYSPQAIGFCLYHTALIWDIFFNQLLTVYHVFINLSIPPPSFFDYGLHTPYINNTRKAHWYYRL
jgi:hypothetical protein